MTEEDVIQEIISTPKYYIGIMKQSTAASFLRRYRKGTAHQNTILRFVRAFGYDIERPAIYKKVEND